MTSERIKCGRHGETPPALACRHVSRGSGLGFCLPTVAPEPWPLGVCNACAAEPEWTDEQAVERICALCTECWEDALDRNHIVRTVDDEDWLHERFHAAVARQNAWIDKFGIGRYKHYYYSVDGDAPWLGFGDTPDANDVRCEAFPIGTWSRHNDTWLWSWANDSWSAAAAEPTVALKRLGEQHGHRHLRRSLVSADEGTARQLAFLALVTLPDVDGIYRSPSENGALYLAARRTHRVV